MAPPRYIPSDSILKKWLDEGLSHQDIVDRILEQDGVRVSKSSVAAAISRAGLSHRIRHDDYIPWSPIRADHATSYVLTMLRSAARRAHGETLPPELEARLDSWIKRLEENSVVVHYDADTAEGFLFVPRRPCDKGLIRLQESAHEAS